MIRERAVELARKFAARASDPGSAPGERVVATRRLRELVEGHSLTLEERTPPSTTSLRRLDLGRHHG